MVSFRHLQDDIIFTHQASPVDSTQKKEAVPAQSTSIVGKIDHLFKEHLGYIQAFVRKAQAGAVCVNHYISMRQALGKVRHLAGPLFQKLADSFKKGAKRLSDSHVVRKLKGLVEYLEEYDFAFERHSEDPEQEESYEESYEELLESYEQHKKQRKQLKAEEMIQDAIMLLEMIGKLSFKPYLYSIRNAMAAEVLTKLLVSQPIAVGQTLPWPCFDREGVPVVRDYVIQEKLSLGTSQLPVFIIIPASQADFADFAPLVIFRGTRLKFDNEVDLRSVVENINQCGPARGAYEEFKKELHHFMHQWFDGEKRNLAHFRIMGFSQGAVLGQRAIVDCAAYLHRGILNASILFNSPGVEEDYYQAWQNISEERQPKVINYIVTHDIVSKRGKQFIGAVYELQPQDDSILIAHFGAKFLEAGWNLYSIDNEKEAECLTRQLINQLMSSQIVGGLYKMALFGLQKMHARNKQTQDSRISSKTTLF